MAKGVIAGWLGMLGYTTQDGPENATHRINIVLDSLGTEAGGTFFGIPPVQASLIPISLPELAFSKRSIKVVMRDSIWMYLKCHPVDL